MSLALLLAAGTTPTAAQSPASPRVFDDPAEFKRYAAVARAERPTLNVTQEAKLERRRAIARALDQVDFADRAGMERVAEQYGLLILSPALKAGGYGEVGGASEPGSLYGIPAPRMVEDPNYGDVSFNGEVQWRDPYALHDDFNYFDSWVGGRDAAGMVFSNITDISKIDGWDAYGYDINGTYRWDSGNPDYTPQDGNKLAVIFSHQDRFLRDGGYYDTWKVTSWVHFKNTWGDVGTVRMTYAHDWDETQFTGADFKVGGDTSKKVAGELVFHWTSSVDRWATAGRATSY